MTCLAYHLLYKSLVNGKIFEKVYLTWNVLFCTQFLSENSSIQIISQVGAELIPANGWTDGQTWQELIITVGNFGNTPKMICNLIISCIWWNLCNILLHVKQYFCIVYFIFVYPVITLNMYARYNINWKTLRN
jgi:hypothetical protein